jgi:hypothetical protein
MPAIKFSQLSTLNTLQSGTIIPVVYNGTNYKLTVDLLKGYVTPVWSEVRNKPTFAEIAFSGDYSVLLNKPTIPTRVSQLQIDVDLGDTAVWTSIIGKPTFATVATSGSYADLINKPNLAVYVTATGLLSILSSYTTQTYVTSQGYITTSSLTWNNITGKPAFATVSTSGSYTHLTNTPVLATVATSGRYGDLSDKPLNLSNFNNDIGLGGGAGDRLVNGDLELVLDSSGTLTTPLLLPRAFTAVLDEAHRTVGSGSYTGPAWEFHLEWQCSQNGQVELMADNPLPSLVAGYANGQTFEFTEADHGIPGYTLSIVLSNVEHNPAGWTANLSFSPPPAYPPTIASSGAIKLASNGNSFVLGTDGGVTFSDGATINSSEFSAAPDSRLYLYGASVTEGYGCDVRIYGGDAGSASTNSYHGGRVRIYAGSGVNGGPGGYIRLRTYDGNNNSYSLELDTDGVLNLPTNGIRFPDNTVQTTAFQGGGVNTNSINNGQYSVSVGTNGVVTMVTSRGTVEFGALPEPGGPSHFHIMKASGDNNDLYFGDDFNYVLQRGPGYGTTPGYGVEIGANDKDSGSQQVWRFGTDGSLTFPNGAFDANSQIYTTNGGYQTVFETFNTGTGRGSGQKLTLDYDAAEVKIQTQTGTEWTFGADGTLKFPLVNEQTYIQEQRYGMGSLVGYLDFEWTLGEYNGTNFGTQGIRINPGIEGYTDLRLPSDASSTNTSVRLANGNLGGVEINSNNNVWTFDAFGVLAFPNLSTFDGQTLIDHASSTNYTLKIANGGVTGSKFGIGTGDATFGIANDALNHAENGYVPYTVTAQNINLTVPGTGTWAFGTDGTTTLASGVEISNTGTFNFLSWNTGTALIIADVPYTAGSYIYIPSSSDTNGSLGIVNTNTAGSIMLSQGNGNDNTTNQLYVNNSGTTINNILGGISKTWTFGTDGSLTLPSGAGFGLGDSGQLKVNDGITASLDFRDTSGRGFYTNGDGYALRSNGNSTWQFGTTGSITFPQGGTLRVSGVPAHSTGATGDKAGTVAFANGYIYYCTADYGQTGHQVIVATLYNSQTLANTNQLQLNKTADTLQITVGDVISDSNGGPTSTVVTVSSDASYTYVGTGGFAYNCVFPLTFTSSNYVAGGDIWKRVAWSGDTW